MSGCKFQGKWLTEPQFKDWLKQDSNVNFAFCFGCNKRIDIKSMGKTALTSHSKSQKHVELLNVAKVGGQSSIGAFVSEKPVPSSSTEKRTPSAASYVTRNDVTSAEVLWCLNTVDKNISFVSNNDITAVF